MGLWDVVNNLTRLRPTHRERYLALIAAIGDIVMSGIEQRFAPHGFSSSRIPQLGRYLPVWEQQSVRTCPFLLKTRRSGQPDCDVNDLALAPSAQWETARLEQP
jgi:hypothetical protein